MFILRHKNINYAKFSYSDLQLPAYTAYRSLQKITNLMVRHLTRPYFRQSSGTEIVTLTLLHYQESVTI